MTQLLKLITLIRALEAYLPLPAIVALVRAALPLPTNDGQVDAWLQRVGPAVGDVLRHYLPSAPAGAATAVTEAAAWDSDTIHGSLLAAGVPAERAGEYVAAIQDIAGGAA